MKVLDYIYEVEGKYSFHIQVQTVDISRSWEKFRVRAKTICPEEYCVYQAKVGGILSVYNCDTGIMEIVPEDSWGTARPVFFETN